METTIDNGPRITGDPLVILISEIVYITAITKKYTLAILENYSTMFKGRKVSNVYFEVLI